MIKWILPIIVAPIATILTFYLKKAFNFTFEFILLFLIFFMWTELNLRIGELKK